jgi:uncharacterized protein
MIRASVRSLPLLFGLALLAAAPAAAQTGPSFDCAKAGTAVEKAICADADLSWLDHTMGRLYAALQAGDKSVRDAQRAWLSARNKCPANGLRDCLAGQYATRFSALSAGYDKAHVTGTYDYGDGTGGMTMVAFPDGTVSAWISTVGAAPSQPVCDIDFDAPASRDRLRWTDPDSPLGDGQHCSIDIRFGGDGAQVTDHGCQTAYCGMNGAFAGRYRRN